MDTYTSTDTYVQPFPYRVITSVRYMDASEVISWCEANLGMEPERVNWYITRTKSSPQGVSYVIIHMRDPGHHALAVLTWRC